jgi:hypothetical protein
LFTAPPKTALPAMWAIKIDKSLGLTLFVKAGLISAFSLVKPFRRVYLYWQVIGMIQ